MQNPFHPVAMCGECGVEYCGPSGLLPGEEIFWTMLPEGIERRGDPAVHPVNGNRHPGCPDIAGQRLVSGQYSQGVCRRFQFIQQGLDNGGVFSLQRRIAGRVGCGGKEIVMVGAGGSGGHGIRK